MKLSNTFKISQLLSRSGIQIQIYVSVNSGSFLCAKKLLDSEGRFSAEICGIDHSSPHLVKIPWSQERSPLLPPPQLPKVSKVSVVCCLAGICSSVQTCPSEVGVEGRGLEPGLCLRTAAAARSLSDLWFGSYRTLVQPDYTFIVQPLPERSL